MKIDWTKVRAEVARALRLRSVVVWFRTRGPVLETSDLTDAVFAGAVTAAIDYGSRTPSGAYVYSEPTPSGTRFLHRLETLSQTTIDLEVVEPSPVPHAGADDGWAAEVTRMVRKHEPLTEEIKRALTTDTGAFDTVQLIAEQDAEERAGAEDPAWVEDELGYWDPDAVDWEEPALFREVAIEALRTGALSPVNLSEVEFVDAIMRRVLEPAR